MGPVLPPYALEPIEEVRKETALTRWVRNHRLLHSIWDDQLIDQLSTTPQTPSVFTGIGLTGRHQPSQGLPIEALSTLLMGEQARQRLDWDRFLVLVADSHALEARPQDAKTIDQVAEEVIRTLDRLARLLPSLRVIKASALVNPEYQATFDSLAPQYIGYLRRQLTDLVYLTQVEQVRLKISWASPGGDYDERYFDRQARLCHIPLSYLFTKVPPSLNPERPVVPPYLNFGDRLPLSPTAQVDQFVSSLNQRPGGRKVAGYLTALTQEWSMTVRPLTATSLAERLQEILEQIFDSR